MTLQLPLGTRLFTLRWGWLALTVAACVLFTGLGFWQWHRGVYRTALWSQFQQQATQALAVNGGELAALQRFTRVSVVGRLDPDHQVVLENLSLHGQPGYQVLTPALLGDGSTLLVNRGWLPYTGFHDRLPDVSFTANDAETLTGRLDALPQPGIALGRVAPAASGPWPRAASFPTLAQLSQVLGRPLAAQVLLLDPDGGPGYAREWQPPGISPERNFGYAIQWWAFAIIALGLFVFLNLEKRR